MAEITHLETAYFPWIGALHVLLDSLIDHADDAAAGHPNLVRHYDTPAAAAERMSWIARSARSQLDTLDRRAPHLLLLTAMSCFYLSSPRAADDHARHAARSITTAMGPLATPMLLILRTRRAAAVASRRARRPSSATVDRDG